MYFFSIDLPILDILSKWTHSYTLWFFVTDFFHLAFILNALKNQPCCTMYQYFVLFLLPNNIPLYGCATFYLMGIWVVSTFWPFMNNACMNICVHVFGHIFSFLLGIDWGVELLGHMVTLCLTFWGTARLFSRVAALFYIPTSSVWGFHFLHILANTCYHLPFWLQPSLWVWNSISVLFCFAFK